MHEFDKTYWERHWTPTAAAGPRSLPTNPYLPAETGHLPVGSALDAGCGTGTEALWLAGQGWQVTGADISGTALATATTRAAAAGLGDRIEWVETDLTRWEPDRTWNLVVTSYAHPDTGQLAFYRRIASWVAPGGTLLIVGHLHGDEPHDHAHPDGATATPAGIAQLFRAPDWRVETCRENTRTVNMGDTARQLRDVIVRARRTP